MADAKQRLYVDCQVFQHHTWNRGMGRYSLKFLEALDKEDIDLILLLNKNIPLDKERLVAIKDACPSAKIKYLRLSENPHKHGGWKNLQEVCSAELDSQLRGILKPTDTYLIASNFSIRYCSAFPSLACRKAVIFWDLTPYLQWDDYKWTPDFEPKKYFAQFKILFEAEQLWAISQSAVDEVALLLGIDDRKVTNIRGASIRNMEERNRRPKLVPASAKFLIAPSADGPHKNNENMVRAFAEFNAKAGNVYKLVITSGFSEQTKSTLQGISSDLIFTGHISDGELGWLFEHCEALLFASKTEGLGLPILEAVSEGKKVVCSDIKVFKEISETAFYFADPNSPESIAQALDEALLGDKHVWDSKRKQYSDISHTYSWPVVAKTCHQLLKAPLETGGVLPASDVAIWYVDSDEPSLSRDIAELLYAGNSGYVYNALRPLEYVYMFPSYLPDMGAARTVLSVRKHTDTKKRVYIIDDTEQAAQLLLIALESPGIIVMTFSKSYNPIKIKTYLKELFENRITYEKIVSLLELAGNRIVHRSIRSSRGSKDFVKEVALVNKEIVEGDK